MMENKVMSKKDRQQKQKKHFCLDLVETSPIHHIRILDEEFVYHKPYWELLFEERERKTEEARKLAEEARKLAEEARKLAEEEAKQKMEMAERQALWKELQDLSESMQKEYNEKLVTIECQAIERIYKDIEKRVTWLKNDDNAVGWFFRNWEAYIYEKYFSSSHHILYVSLFIEQVLGKIDYNPDCIFCHDVWCDHKEFLNPAKRNYEDAEHVRESLVKGKYHILHYSDENIYHYCKICSIKDTCSNYSKDGLCNLDFLRTRVKIVRDFYSPPKQWCAGRVSKIKNLRYEQDRLWEKLQKVKPYYKIVPNYKNIEIAVGILSFLIILLIILFVIF